MDHEKRLREILLRKPVLVRIGNGLAAPLRRQEVRQLEIIAARQGYRNVAIWCACKLREILEQASEPRHGARGDRGSNARERSETATVLAPGREAAAERSPLLSWRDGSPPTVADGLPEKRSWLTLEPEERIRLAAEWREKVPYPAEFAGYARQEKLAWIERNWPLAPPAGLDRHSSSELTVEEPEW